MMIHTKALLFSEVTDINKQKFLAELAKLLTFMYEEDRQTALTMYERMFDRAEDEMALIQLLGSPTKQAVIVARAYSARERKLEVQSQSREAGSPAAPNASADYIQAINQIQASAIAQRIIPPEVTSGQFTLFDDDDQEHTEAYSLEGEPAAPAPAPKEPAAVPPAPEPAAAAEEPQSAPQEPAEEAAPAEEEPAPQPEPQPQPKDQVDEFLEHFSVEGNELKEPTSSEKPAPAPAEAPSQPEPPILELADEEEMAPAPVGTVRKPRIFLLILYVLFAVPVTAVATVLLLLPTLLFLMLAVAIIAAGVAIFIAAFSGFAVFADLMVVVGTALVTLALGLLCLWIFVWFIGGAIVGLIRSVIELGGSWCFKEVPVK